MAKKKKKRAAPKPPTVQRPKEFLDLIAPGAIQFNTDNFVFGNTYRTVMMLRGYPPTTEEQALLRQLGELEGVTVHLAVRKVSAAEEEAILHAATNKSRMERSNISNVKQSITAEAKLQDTASLILGMRRDREPLLHTSVFLELTARTMEELQRLRDSVSAILLRGKLSKDPLLLRQRDGFLSSNPAGRNTLGTFAERVLPASSAANLFFLSYSGKTDPHGFFIGRDKYGSNVIVDLDRRAPDKTNGSSLILGNTGQGKSYLLKLLLCNVREVGKNVIALDSEHELEDLCEHLGGCFLDIFRVYKGFDTPHIDTLELMIERLYQQWGISDETDLSQFGAMNYPVMTDLYDLIERTYQHYDQESLPLYPPEMLRDLLLGLHSMCKGADFRFFNGHTNISSDRFLVFCVKGLDDVAENLRNTLLFNVLSYMSDRLLTAGNTVATIDELYLWLSNPVAITYIRNALKRVRKRGSSMVLASQNLEDFDQPGVRELTRPLFAIPTHQFLFNAGTIDKRFYMDLLQLEPEEYELIRQSQRGICLYKCGNERYLLEVHAPSYKEKLFGAAGGR